MGVLNDSSQHFRSRSILPNTRQAFTLFNEWNFKSRYPPETEPLDDPEEPTKQKTDVTEGVDHTEDATFATDATATKDADSAAGTKIVIHSDSATLALPEMYLPDKTNCFLRFLVLDIRVK